MWKLKKHVIGITLLFLVGCQTQPEVFFENINIGDNLETCLAKGVIKYKFDHHYDNGKRLALSDNITTNYLPYTEVKFDDNNIVKELEFSRHADYEAVEEAFSFMTQYFCQRYENMATEKIDEVKDEGNYRQIGSKNIWETNKIKIILSSYNNMVDWQAVARNAEKPGSNGWIEEQFAKEKQGYWVELIITAK